MTARTRWLALAGVVLIAGAAAAALLRWRHPTPVRAAALGRVATNEASVPANTRVRVEIINATKTRGLARRATRLLRDRGFDVVTFATSGTQQDSTVVLDRTNHPDWAKRVGEALGGARVLARPDT